jgi:hypothetical protein
MKEKSDDEEAPQRKSNPVKMQDFFNIHGNNDDNSQNQIKKNSTEKADDNNKDTKNALFDIKDSIYKSIYAPSPAPIQTREKPKVTLQRKNNLLNFKKDNNKINDDLSYIEPVGLFIDDNNKKLSEIIIQNYECKFIFDDIVEREFISLVHFSSKYFEFPVFYVYKGTYDESSHITTVTLKDYRSYKIWSSNNKIYKKLSEPPVNKVDFYKYAQFFMFCVVI